jgi:hypothetical protein
MRQQSNPDLIAWDKIGGPLAAAEDALARLDERVRASPIAEGFVCRSHFQDACANLWLAGELVVLEDLVLHDARMDIRSPTHEVTRAQAVLRARRKIAAAAPDWALSPDGLEILRGAADGGTEETTRVGEGEDAGDDAPESRAATAAQAEPPLLAAALLWDAWESDPPLERQAWLGALLVAATLRARQKTRSHLTCANSALRLVRRERRRARDRATRLAAFLEAIAAGAEAGMKDHDRWLLARQRLEGRLTGRRSSSRLPALVEFILARPIASAGMIAAELGVTPRAAQDMVAELGLREMTGRGRYRAWGIL